MVKSIDFIPLFFIITACQAFFNENYYEPASTSVPPAQPAVVTQASVVKTNLTTACIINELNTLTSPICEAEINKINCDRMILYRTYDGTCNNPQVPWWGAANTPYSRFLKPHFDDDSNFIRNLGLNNHALPGAREIARILEFKPRFSGRNTLLTFMGQFVVHDSALTKTENDPCPCGTQNTKCQNIAIPLDDEALINQGECIPFPRAADVSDFFECNFKRRQQFSENTHFLDLSTVYGSSKEVADELRINQFGLLKYSFIHGTSKEALPILDINECDFGESADALNTKSEGCFFAGDKRVDQNSLLTGLHAIFHQEHNYIARKLSILNPHWYDETVFQETRRILIACYQNIIYSEFLPAIIGRELMEEFKLFPHDTGYLLDYNKDVNPNYFAEAVTFGMRLHTLVHNRVSPCLNSNFTVTRTEPLSHFLFNSQEIFKNFDEVTCALLQQATYPMNFQLAPSLSEFLNMDFPNRGDVSSLSAINIQRGRDMGIPSYVNYRKLFGLPTANDWDSAFPEFDDETIVKLRSVYKNVEDIDVFVGVAGEKAVEGGLVGKTQATMIAIQFHNLKFGDSFYYENGHDTRIRFTPEQLNEIRHFKMSSLLCNSLTIDAVQRYAFSVSDITDQGRRAMKLEFSNPLVHCENLFQINFNLWKDDNIAA